MEPLSSTKAHEVQQQFLNIEAFIKETPRGELRVRFLTALKQALMRQMADGRCEM